MIGLSILLAVVIYIWLARLVAKRIKNRSAKYVVIAIFILIPTWDIVPGKIYFNHLCENEAGLKIYKTVEGVEGYRVYPGAGGLGPGPDGFKKYGYKFEEWGSGSDFARYTLGPDGKITKQQITESIARYAAVGKGWTPLSWNVSKYEVFIFDQQTKERLATRATFSTVGNWLQAFFSPLLGGGDHCGPSGKDLYLNTLKPAKSTN